MFSPTPSSISRTVQYRKITKPLLERKRRARINRCLDELKDLMYSALEAEGENVEKLEKADILEFTVRHLQKITRRDPVEEAYRFQEGFSHCASEACTFLLSLPGLDTVVGRRLVEYLAKSVSRALESQLPAAAAADKRPAATPTAAAAASNEDDDDDDDDDSPETVADAVARGHTPPSSDTPPAATSAAPQWPQCPREPQQTTAAVQQRKPVALSASNRGPAAHTVIRPKPTRPAAFGGSPSQHDAAAAVAAATAAAAAAARRDPMWRPW